MKTIQLLLSGLFLIGTLLWVRTAAQRCLDSDFRQWQSRFSKKLIGASKTIAYRIEIGPRRSEAIRG